MIPSTRVTQCHVTLEARRPVSMGPASVIQVSVLPLHQRDLLMQCKCVHEVAEVKEFNYKFNWYTCKLWLPSTNFFFTP